MTFHVGEKVRCICSHWENLIGEASNQPDPEAGHVYTVSDNLSFWSEHYISLEGFPDTYYIQTKFRKLPKTDISIFQQMLVPTKERVS